MSDGIWTKVVILAPVSVARHVAFGRYSPSPNAGPFMISEDIDDPDLPELAVIGGEAEAVVELEVPGTGACLWEPSNTMGVAAGDVAAGRNVRILKVVEPRGSE